jgi:type IV pilus assembly protein PilP
MNNVVLLKVINVTLTITIFSAVLFAQESSLADVSSVDTMTGGNAYFYNSEGRSDPFKPFVTPKSSSAVSDPNEIIDEANSLTGMQLFEPGQLTLVGIILSSTEPIALVEDQTRKGYILKLGNPIGRRGLVTSIDSHQMIITETAKTRGGKELKTTTVMRLKKEGDE